MLLLMNNFATICLCYSHSTSKKAHQTLNQYVRYYILIADRIYFDYKKPVEIS